MSAQIRIPATMIVMPDPKTGKSAIIPNKKYSLFFSIEGKYMLYGHLIGH
jgi:hypothetical protein